MATAKKVTELSALTNAAATDLLYVIHSPSSNAQSQKITVASFFGNVSTNAVFNANVSFMGKVMLSNTAAPTSASATGTKGEIRYDDGYIYICTATNTWKRAAISTWS